MIKHRFPCNDAENLFMPRDAHIPTRCPFKICSRCANLVTNPSFETGLSGWETDNVVTSNGYPFEGTQAAKLESGVASMFQDISLSNLCNWPLFLSFNVYPGSLGLPITTGNLVVEVSWLDANHNPISTGLRLFVPSGRIALTYFGITDRPPAGAAWARLQFSKGIGASSPADNDIIAIDQVILTPVGSINLVQNPSFEAGLAHWTPEPSTSFIPYYSFASFEGLAFAVTIKNGKLLQDVPINHLPAGSTFMLSFAAAPGGNAFLTVEVQVQWLDAADNPIGSGINLFIPNETLRSQNNYLTYLDITDPAPVGTVKARIIFTANPADESNMLLDQVIFARVATKNLVINPSFKDGLTGWTSVNTTSFSKDDVYEGNNDAQMGQNGGSLVQDVPIVNAVGRCFLFNCGLGYRRKTKDPASAPQMIVKVLWLDNRGREIGLGLSIISNLIGGDLYWLVYTGITEPAPPGTAAARLQFTNASLNSVIEVDKVVLGRLI